MFWTTERSYSTASGPAAAAAEKRTADRTSSSSSVSDAAPGERPAADGTGRASRSAEVRLHVLLPLFFFCRGHIHRRHDSKTRLFLVLRFLHDG